MRHPTTAHWQDALRYLIDAKDAPQDAQTDAQRALDAYDLACRIESDERHNAMTTLQALHAMERELPTTALNKVLTGKRPNLDTLLRDIEQTRTVSDLSRQRAEVAQRVEQRCRSRVCGGVLDPHRHDLVQWIAKRRHAAGHQCGAVDTLPTQVQVIYAHVRPTWSPVWDEALTLGTLTHLPLLYDPTWTTDARASLAWVWEQVAEGEVETVARPGSHDPETAPQVTLPKRRVFALPEIPN